MAAETFEGKPCRHGHGTTRYVLDRKCVVCRRKQGRAAYAANPEPTKARSRARVAADPERKRADDARWRAENAERKRETDAAYRLANPERVTENRRRWQRENRDRHNENNRRSARNNPDSIRRNVIAYRGRKRGAAGHFTTGQAALILTAQGGKCAYCEVSEDLHIDHIIPLARGGSNWPWNLQWLCAHHNKAKAARTDAEYRAILGLPQVTPFSTALWRILFIAA